jgi:4-aminobutyrate aminotransferase
MLADTFPDPLDSVLFLNSGSETIDAALKLARRVTGRPGIIAFRGAFHGRTFGATSVTTSSLNYRTGYEPLLPGVYFAPYPAAYPEFRGDEAAASASSLAILDSLLRTIIAPSQVAAILIEPVLGEGGYYPAPAAFLAALRALCDQHGILLIADEVQSGYGGRARWGIRASGIVPASCASRGDRNGLPLSAVVTRTQTSPALRPGRARLDVRRRPGRRAAGVACWRRSGRALVENARARGGLSGGLRRLMADTRRSGTSGARASDQGQFVGTARPASRRRTAGPWRPGRPIPA